MQPVFVIVSFIDCQIYQITLNYCFIRSSLLPWCSSESREPVALADFNRQEKACSLSSSTSPWQGDFTRTKLVVVVKIHVLSSIRDLGLKMTDLQCRKFHYAGNKFQVLGKVSTTVQCIDKGYLRGVNFHIKGLVVSDLNKVLDTHCVTGTKMKEFLMKSVKKRLYGSCRRRRVSHGSQCTRAFQGCC